MKNRFLLLLLIIVCFKYGYTNYKYVSDTSNLVLNLYIENGYDSIKEKNVIRTFFILQSKDSNDVNLRPTLTWGVDSNEVCDLYFDIYKVNCETNKLEYVKPKKIETIDGKKYNTEIDFSTGMINDVRIVNDVKFLYKEFPLDLIHSFSSGRYFIRLNFKIGGKVIKSNLVMLKI